MRELTSRERLTRLFANQEIDRIPIWLLFPYHKISCYVDVYEQPAYKRVLKTASKYADIFDRRQFKKGFCLSVSSEIMHEYKEKTRGDKIIEQHFVKYGNIELKEEKTEVNGVKTTTEKMVKNIVDLEKILSMPYVPPEPDVEGFFAEKEELGDRGLMMVDIGDPLQILYHLCRVDQFAIWTITEREKLLNFLDEMYDRYYKLYKYLLDKGVGPVYFIVGAEFAGPPTVSPSDFNDLSARYVKGIVDLIRDYGMKSIVHYHGNLKQVLPGFKYINPDGLHTIEAPPTGDCTIKEAREILDNMILIGNIQYEDLTSKNEDEIEEMVKNAIKQGKEGRFILSPTAGPYEKYIPEQMQKNYIRFMKSGYEHGKY